MIDYIRKPRIENGLRSNSDVAKCMGGSCSERFSCERFMAPSSGIDQRWAAFDSATDGTKCKFKLEYEVNYYECNGNWGMEGC